MKVRSRRKLDSGIAERSSSSAALRWPLPESVVPPAVAVRQAGGFPALPVERAVALAVGERWQATCASAVRWRCSPAWGMPPRTCPDDMFMLVESGRMWTEVGGRRHDCAAGDLLHWRRNQVHSAGWSADPLVVVALHYGSCLPDGGSLPARLAWPTRLATGGDPSLAALFYEAAALGVQQPPGWRSRLDAQVTLILARLIDRHGGAFAPGTGAGSSAAWTRIRPAVEALLANLAAPPGMASMARRCNLSEAQFRRLFAAATGQSPRAWLGGRRTEAACHLLRDGTGIAAVAAATGFADTAAFTAAFRRATGLPPGRWREENAL